MEVDQARGRRQRRVDGEERLKFDFRTGVEANARLRARVGRRRRCAASGAALAGVDGVIRPFANVGLFGGFADADGHMRDSLPDWLRHDGTAADLSLIHISEPTRPY